MILPPASEPLGSENASRSFGAQGVSAYAKVFCHRKNYARLGLFLPLVDEYLAFRGLSIAKTTLRMVRTSLHLFLSYLQEVRDLDIGPAQVTRQLVLEFQEWNVARNLSLGCVIRHTIVIRAYFQWLSDEGVIRPTDIELIRLPKRLKALPRPLSIKEISSLFSVLDPTDILELRDLAIFELLYGSGMRIGDALRIDIRDLELDHEILGPTVRVVCKGQTDQIIPIAKASVPILRLYHLKRQPAADDTRLFVNKAKAAKSVARPSSIGVRWKHYLQRAGLPSKYTMHMLRHSAATHLYANGMALEKIKLFLGHTKLGQTQEYARITPLQIFKVYSTANIRGLVEEHLQTLK